tara:strand:- start:245 stop:2080 length:1836 start_codon:yes stop_codon:yes gene_type:complete
MKKILITGSSSRFAESLKKVLFGENIFYTSKTELDITKIDSIEENIKKIKPKILIHIAGLSRPMNIHDKNIEESIDKNIIGTCNVVKICKKYDVKLIYISTNYVYPGRSGNYREDDGLKPINNYAWSKLGGESCVMLYKNSLILRLAMSEKPFVHNEAFTDARSNFLYRDEVAKILPRLLDYNGVINIGSQKSETIFNFAKKTKPNIKPVSVKKVANFPIDSSVNIEKLERLIGEKSKSLKTIYAAGPSVTQLEREIIDNMMKYGWDNYDYVERFEKEFADYHNRKYCLMTPSCTLAIYLTLKTLNIKKGDEIIVPDVTWTASVSPIVEIGAKPVFVDIDERNWCINIDQLKKNINKKTKAILAVDLFGNLPNMKELKKICKKNNLYFLEDSAEALGTEYGGIKAGKFGDVSFHSFHRTKTITSGEGGVLLTDKKKIFLKAKHLRDLGRSKKNSYIADDVSLKYMPSNLQAAMAYGQFKRLKELLKIKRNIFNQYKINFSNFNVVFNNDDAKLKNGLWATVIIFDKKYNLKVSKLIYFLKNKKIYSREFFRPLTSQPAYKKFADKKVKKRNKISYDLYKNALVLPGHYNLQNEDIKKISKNIINFLLKKSR